MRITTTSLGLVQVALLAITGAALAQTASTSRVSATQKGSLLIFSKVEIKWSADGKTLLQDTILDISNDYPGDVDVQAFFINGDGEVEEVCVGLPCANNIIQEAEPGWNTADCRFTLTANQPHSWSAASGSDKCQPFTVLDAGGPGRPDPETGMTTRILRGYVVMFAVDFVPTATTYGEWQEIRWNHLMGTGTVVNYDRGTAWAYNPWAFQTSAVPHGEPLGDPGVLNLDGIEYEAPFGNLILDFYASGSTALSGEMQSVQVDTDLTIHAVSADLRQDGCGPVLTKVVADVWNENESKFSGTRRCVCCWDQTMLSDWVRTPAAPNHFLRTMLGTDRGKARLDSVSSLECDYETFCGSLALQKRQACEGVVHVNPPNVDGSGGESVDAAILGLGATFLDFRPSGTSDIAAINIAGAGRATARIEYDVQEGPSEAFDGSVRVKRSGSKSVRGHRVDLEHVRAPRTGVVLPPE